MRRSGPRTVVAFLLSVLVHPLAVGCFLLISYLTSSPRPPRVEQRPVSLRTVSSKQWQANRGNAQPERPAELHPKGQVVDVEPGNHERAPDAKYLAETDNKVEKQTRAKEQTNKYSVAKPKNAPHPEVMPSARGRAGVEAPSQPVTLASQLEHLTETGGRRPRLGPLLNSAMAAEEHQGESSSAGEEERGADTATPALGGGAPNDDLKEQQGEGTFLNTREWKYASFFNRVKQAVSAHWDPNGKLKQKDPSGKYFADRSTLLGVTLRPDGSIADMYVVKSCGLDWLDQEAMAAFERAQPFSNPPAALVENGYIRFTFGFSITRENTPFMFRTPMPGARTR